MRLIDADALKKDISGAKKLGIEAVAYYIDQQPTAVVRCGECVHCYAEGFAHERNICEKHPELGNVPDDWFCADGEREVQE